MHDILRTWRALRGRLEARARELADEVRAYPGPIARCDDQLPALIAERSRALELARLAEALERERETLSQAEWIDRLSSFAGLVRPRDQASGALHAALLEALGRRSENRESPA